MARGSRDLSARVRALAAALIQNNASAKDAAPDDAQSQMRETMAASAELWRRGQKSAGRFVQSQPMTAMGVSFMVGLLLGGIWRRR
ncbi:hypothetical protein ACT6QH_02560 [Xanthobacter sp. TB0139]|uniref:hypothetical protein n=1 Tax=Xanthobacter sp. TB0139 TaxID=3459178 RepID=UPI004039F8A9